MRARRSILIAAILLAGVRANAANKDTELILSELRALQAQLSQLQRAQSDIQQALQQVSSTVAAEQGTTRKALVDTQTTVDDMKESVSILTGKLDEANARLRNMTQELSALRQTQPIVVPAAPAGSETPTGESPSAPSTPPSPSPAPPLPAAMGLTADSLYTQAYTDYTQARYPLAISGFKDVLARFPDSDYADNAQYWIGECLLAQRKYKEALEAFDAVVSLYPGSNKLDVATLKKAYALEGLGSRADAVRQFELVIDKFPKSESARVARERLRNPR